MTSRSELPVSCPRCNSRGVFEQANRMTEDASLVGGLASEGGHWYGRDGSAQYQIIGKNGKLRDVTLRDARKLNLLPSVSGIIDVEAKPALTRWFVEQAYMACLTLPRIEGETLENFKMRAATDAGMQAELARARGNVIHAEIERYLVHGRVENDQSLPFVVPVADWLDRNFGKVVWATEKSFAHPFGFGGKVDLHTRDTNEQIVLDFKTKAFDAEKATKKMAWDGHAMQIHAYANGLGLPHARKFNLFISTTVPGLLVGHEWLADSDYQWEAFRHLLRVWQLRKQYDTRFTP